MGDIPAKHLAMCFEIELHVLDLPFIVKVRGTPVLTHTDLNKFLLTEKKYLLLYELCKCCKLIKFI